MSEEKISNKNFFNFDINLNIPKKSIQEITKVATKELTEIAKNPFDNYLNENDKVFSGEVAKEINKYHAQMYALGQVMREGQPKRTFSINM